MAKVCIIGLGYVGLPLAKLCASKGHDVIGIDNNKALLAELEKAKISNLDLTSDSQQVSIADVVIVCVPTPIDKYNMPDLSPLKSAVSGLVGNISQRQLILIESTIFPGTVEDVLLPIFAGSGLKVGEDFYLAHCPERIDPGNPDFDVSNISRVVGGVTDNCLYKAADFYESILDSAAKVTKLSSVKAAEATKMVENIFRDVNIAMVNELAMSFDKMGIDIVEVVKGASSKPFAFMPHYPGCGVGGHCIPVDPYYLIEKAKQQGFEHKFLSLARKINEGMASYTVQKAIDAILKARIQQSKVRVLILGLAYKPEIEDVRESPAFEVIEELEEKGINPTVYDPFVLEKSDFTDLNSALKNQDCVILVTAHSEFMQIDAAMLKANNVKIVVDGRNVLGKSDIERNGIVYKGIGR